MRRFTIACWLGALVIGIGLLTPALADGPAVPLEDRLKSSDPAVVRGAVQDIGAGLDLSPMETMNSLRSRWLQQLIDGGHADWAADLADRAALTGAMDVWRCDEWLNWEIKAALLAHDAARALRAAKSLFNVCPMQNTQQTLRMLALALGARGTAENGTVQQLIDEELDGAQRAGNLGVAAEDPRPRNVITAIHIDPQRFLVAAARLNDDDPSDLLAHVNLLLMADEPEEAERVAQRLRPTDADGPTVVREMRARTARAWDGTIGRANQIARGAD
jgi:hypothetical protein